MPSWSCRWLISSLSWPSLALSCGVFLCAQWMDRGTTAAAQNSVLLWCFLTYPPPRCILVQTLRRRHQSSLLSAVVCEAPGVRRGPARPGHRAHAPVCGQRTQRIQVQQTVPQWGRCVQRVPETVEKSSFTGRATALFAGASMTRVGLSPADKPHNPMVNAGAIVISSLIKVKSKAFKRNNIKPA